jgi:ribonuclease Z
MIRITMLGTAAARPTVARNVSAMALQREGDLWLVDCGEGTQRQMMRYGTGFGIRGILVTHLHGDHILGIPGLMKTMALQGREEPLPVYGPPGSAPLLESLVHLGGRITAFPTPINEIAPGESLGLDDYRLEAYRVQHGVPALGYALVEDPRPGRFDVDRARALGIPEGPLFGRLHRGEAVEVEGHIISPDAVVGPPRPGRRVVLTGDTRPTPATVEIAQGAEVLIHDATFTRDESARARETFHSTAAEAGEIAAAAGVKRLLLTHVSARYSAIPAPLEHEAREHFPGAVVAHDGLVLEIGYGPDQEPDPTVVQKPRKDSM